MELLKRYEWRDLSDEGLLREPKPILTGNGYAESLNDEFFETRELAENRLKEAVANHQYKPDGWLVLVEVYNY